jgi:GT2 family glycosyltransferase
MIKISIIIPTCKQPDSIFSILDCLDDQSLSPKYFEVIVVLDGLSLEKTIFSKKNYIFQTVLLQQPSQGATVARNNGALHSQGEVLIFIDDDVTISTSTLETLYYACISNKRILATGRLIQRSPSEANLFARLVSEKVNMKDEIVGSNHSDEYIPFSFCNTQLLAIRRDDFIELGMMQDPNRWHYWDDVEFGYRAYLAGFKLLKCSNAQGVHWDISLSNLNIACQRWYKASKAAVDLFKRHPGLELSLPMFYDKMPINWSKDPRYLIARKVARRVVSGKIPIFLMEQAVSVMEKILPNPKILIPFYYWIQGGYMLMGYYEGLKEAGNSTLTI